MFNPFKANNASRQPTARGEQCLKADFLGVLTYFRGSHSIGYIHVLHINFDVYDTCGVEGFVHMLLAYSFSFNCHK